MRSLKFAGISTAALVWSSAANAADNLQFGPVPSWTESLPIPAKSNTPEGAPITVLLTDQQILLEPGKTTIFGQAAMKIQTAQGLVAGNISIPWNPATDTLTVHKLHILRGDKVIDVLAEGQKFTTLRRESNLELAILDGRLTANIQPEGLQEGDIIFLATSIEQSDPILKGHLQALFADWDAAPIQTARVRIIWPEDRKLQTKLSGDLPKATVKTVGKRKVFELQAEALEPTVISNGAPGRFRMGRLGEASDFASWAEVAALMLPLYDEASKIPAGGALRAEAEKIKQATSDPARRTELALQLVQDRVRYVALLMDNGGYVPATAEETWSRRFGDCKGKTTLLLALLRELGIDAEPVLVSSSMGDALGERQPMLSLFDHVLVRVRLNGKSYWLDGTRSGDGQLASLRVPNFRWGLPVVDKATLVSMVPEPLALANSEKAISIDASEGILAPVPVSIERVLRGDSAIFLNNSLASATPTQRDEFMRAMAKDDFDSITLKSTKSDFDRNKTELRISLKGDAKLDWNGVWYAVPAASIAYTPDFERSAGPGQEAPFALGYPSYEIAKTTIKLPPTMVRDQKYPAAVSETVAGVMYERSMAVKDGVLEVSTSEKVVSQEISYKDALAAAPRLRKLSDDDVYLRLPDNYALSKSDFEARKSQSLSTADEYVSRGNQFLNAMKLDEALADFNQAAKLDPKNVWAFANLGVTYVWKDDPKEAEKHFALADAIEPNNVVVSRGRGLLFLNEGDPKSAVTQFTRSVEREPNNIFALINRARAYYALNQLDAALADTDQVLKLAPGNAEVRLFRANLFVSLSRWEDAGKEAELIIAEQPKSDFALIAAAKTFARIGKNERAMSVFDQALALSKKSLVYLNRAQARPLSDRKGRMADIDESLRIEPDNFDALAAKAYELSATGKPAEAAKIYEKLVKLAPDEPQIKVRLAGMLYKAGNQARANEMFNTLRKEAKTPVELNNLCWEKATLGILLDSAFEECREAVQQKPDHAGYADSLGMVLLKLGRYQESVAAYDKSLINRNAAVSLMGRAFAHAGAGNKDKSNADRAAAIKLDPEIVARFATYGLN